MWCRALGVTVMLTLSLLAAPLAAEAPSPRKVHRIGFLWNSSPSLTRHLLAAFRHGCPSAVMSKAHTSPSRAAMRGRIPLCCPLGRRDGRPPGGGHRHVGGASRPGRPAGDQHDSGRDGRDRRPRGGGFRDQPRAPGGQPDGPQPHGPRVKWETAGTAQRNRASALPGGGAGEPGESHHRCRAARDPARRPGLAGAAAPGGGPRPAGTGRRVLRSPQSAG